MSAWYQPGSATLTAGARLVPTAFVDSVSGTDIILNDNLSHKSNTVDVLNYLTKSINIKLTTTGTITDYRVQITTMASDSAISTEYGEIATDIYIKDGIYHWNYDDGGGFNTIFAKQWGTASAGNYVTVEAFIEASAS